MEAFGIEYITDGNTSTYQIHWPIFLAKALCILIGYGLVKIKVVHDSLAKVFPFLRK